MLSDKYRDLPDGMDQHEVVKAFDELFRELADLPNLDDMDVLEAMYQLADRQWHAYEMLPMPYKERLQQWIDKHWHACDKMFVRKVGFIGGCVGLPGVLRRLEEELQNPEIPTDIRDEISKVTKDIQLAVDDPYFGMPKK